MSYRSFLTFSLLMPFLALPLSADMGQIHVHVEGVSVSESAQKAIILHNNREEVLILGTEMQASRSMHVVRFIPFPSEPQVALAPQGVFDRLAELVAKYRLQYATMWQSKGGPAEMRGTGVEVHLATRLGAHDLTVIRVRDVAAFRKWATDYFRKKGMKGAGRFKEAEAVVADYVARGIDWFVLDAVELTPDKRFVDPVAYRFKSASLYYPLKTSNTFGGTGEIELFIAAPTTLCAPGSNTYFEDGQDRAIDANGRTAGPCLGLSVKASTSALLVPEEGDIEKLLPDAGKFFGAGPVFLQAIRYAGAYHFDNDVLVPMPAGVAKALAAPKPSGGDEPWMPHMLLPEDRAECRLAPDPGSCKGRFERYYYDPASHSCKVFFWGGCQGEVPFETLEECAKTCSVLLPGQ